MRVVTILSVAVLSLSLVACDPDASGTAESAKSVAASGEAEDAPVSDKVPPDGDLCLLVAEQEITEMFDLEASESEPGPGGMAGCTYNFRSGKSDELTFSIRYGSPQAADGGEDVEFHGLKARLGPRPGSDDASCDIDIWLKPGNDSVLSVSAADTAGENPKLCEQAKKLAERAYEALPDEELEPVESSKSLPKTNFCRKVTEEHVARALQLKRWTRASYPDDDTCHYVLRDKGQEAYVSVMRGPGITSEATRISFENLDARLFNGGQRENCALDVRLKPGVDDTGFHVRIGIFNAPEPPCEGVQKVAKLVYDRLPG